MPKDYWGPCGESTPEGWLPILMKAKRRRIHFFLSSFSQDSKMDQEERKGGFRENRNLQQRKEKILGELMKKQWWGKKGKETEGIE